MTNAFKSQHEFQHYENKLHKDCKYKQMTIIQHYNNLFKMISKYSKANCKFIVICFIQLKVLN